MFKFKLFIWKFELRRKSRNFIRKKDIFVLCIFWKIYENLIEKNSFRFKNKKNEEKTSNFKFNFQICTKHEQISMTSLPSNRLKVFCRLRNPPPSDMRSPDLFKLNPFTNSIELENRTLYSFNKILSNTSQQEIFDSIMSPIIRDSFLYSISNKNERII